MCHILRILFSGGRVYHRYPMGGETCNRIASFVPMQYAQWIS